MLDIAVRAGDDTLIRILRYSLAKDRKTRNSWNYTLHKLDKGLIQSRRAMKADRKRLRREEEHRKDGEMLEKRRKTAAEDNAKHDAKRDTAMATLELK